MFAGVKVQHGLSARDHDIPAIKRHTLAIARFTSADHRHVVKICGHARDPLEAPAGPQLVVQMWPERGARISDLRNNLTRPNTIALADIDAAGARMSKQAELTLARAEHFGSPRGDPAVLDHLGFLQDRSAHFPDLDLTRGLVRDQKIKIGILRMTIRKAVCSGLRAK